MNLQQYDRFEATFQPQRTDELVEGAAEWIGWRAIWSADWVIEDEYAYAGEWHCSHTIPVGEWHGTRPPFVWVPSCDLTDIKMLWRIEGFDNPAEIPAGVV